MSCCSKDRNQDVGIQMKAADYEIKKEEYKVAEYNSESVKKEYLKINEVDQSNIIWFKTFFRDSLKSGIFGVLVFLFFYYIAQFSYQIGGFNTCGRPENNSVFNWFNSTLDVSAEEAAVCNKVWYEWVMVMQTNEDTATRYLTFFLGFYVSQMIKRWWDQVKSLPDIDCITNCMAGFVQLGFQDVNGDKHDKKKKAALQLRKKIARYCLLSWTMCLSAISKPLHKNFNDPKKYIDKGLLKDDELKALQDGTHGKIWKEQWWMPLTWAISLVNTNHKQGCDVKDHKDIISQLNRFQSNLQDVSLFHSNPLPLIYGQAMQVAVYTWIFLGIFASQNLDIPRNVFYRMFFTIPWFQIVKVVLIMAWLKVANIVKNPFGDDPDDTKLEEMLDHSIWKASLSIKQMDNPLHIQSD